MLRGWYNRITVSLYGFFKEVGIRPPDARPDPKVDRPPVIVEPRVPVKPEIGHERPERAPFPERLERGPERGLERYERGPPDMEPERPERSPRISERWEEHRPSEKEKKISRERSPVVPSPQRRKSPSSSPLTVTATVAETTAAKPTTPPGSPREEVGNLVKQMTLL